MLPEGPEQGRLTEHSMKGTGLRRSMLALADVSVVVSNAKNSARWWTKNLGFATLTIGGTGHAIMVAPPGDRFVLHLCEGFAALEPGNTGIGFVTDDLDRLAARMTKGQVEFTEPPHKETWGKMAKFADPDGNVFWLFEGPAALVRATLKSRAASPKRPPTKRRTRPRKRSTPPTTRGRSSPR